MVIGFAGAGLIGFSVFFCILYILSLKTNHVNKPFIKLTSELFRNYPFVYFLTGLIAGCVFFKNMPAGFITGVFVYFLPGLIKKWEMEKKRALLNSQLVEAVGIIGSSLKAGFSLLQGIDTAAKRLAEPISEHLGNVVRENRLGVALKEALIEMGNRVKSRDMDLVITATLVSHETGGNLTEVYEKIALTIRDRNMMRLKLDALTSQGKLQGIIVGLLPLALLLILSRIAPDMVSQLFNSVYGNLMLAGVIILEGLGIYFIRKITRIE